MTSRRRRRISAGARHAVTLAVAVALASSTSSLGAQRTFGAAPPLHPGDSTIVITLGTGMPVPDPERSGPATAVVVGTRVFLFDAGPGVMRRIAAAGLPIDGVSALFFTHLHSDHTLGYPDLVLTSWVMGRTRPFAVFGPHGTQRMTDMIYAAWAEDIDIRTKGLERQTPGAYRVAVHEIARGGVVFDSGGVKVTAIAVPHGSWKEAYGYRIDTPTRHVVISGDTRYSTELELAARGVDVLVHEAYPAGRATPEARLGGALWPSYMKSFHTSDVEVGRLAARARPKLLLLTHVVWRGGTPNEVLAGVRKGGFTGRTIVARDLARY